MAGGKRAGTRRAEKPGGGTLATLGHALAITACIVAWGYLVFAAIEFGSTARGGDSEAWWLLLLATLGAVACLFVGILVGSRLLRSLGVATQHGAPSPPGTTGSTTGSAGSRRSLTGSAETIRQPTSVAPPRIPGGHRALR